MVRTVRRVIGLITDAQPTRVQRRQGLPSRRRSTITMLVLSEFQIEVFDEVGRDALNSIQISHRVDASHIAVLSALHILENHGLVHHTPYLGWEQT